MEVSQVALYQTCMVIFFVVSLVVVYNMFYVLGRLFLWISGGRSILKDWMKDVQRAWYALVALGPHYLSLREKEALLLIALGVSSTIIFLMVYARYLIYQ